MVRPPLVACVLLVFVLLLTPTAAQVPNGGPINVLQAQVKVLQQQVADLLRQVADLKAQLAEAGESVLTTYEQLNDVPCTTAIGSPGVVHLAGLMKNPICAAGISADGRFFDLGPVVLDTRTNLMWEKKTTAVGSGANPSDLHDVDNSYYWCEATGTTGSTNGNCAGNDQSWIDAVRAEGFAGFNDWRVPTTNELIGIVSSSEEIPRIDPIFGPTRAALYWDNGAFLGYFAEGVDFQDGGARYFLSPAPSAVRAVRSGS